MCFSRWKFHQIALEMLCLLVRHDIRLPQNAVRVFAKNLVHDTIQIRKVCIHPHDNHIEHEIYILVKSSLLKCLSWSSQIQ